MQVVVNHLPIRPDADWHEMARRFDLFLTEQRPAHPEIRTMQLVRATDTEAIVVIGFADAGSMAEFSSKIAGPWFAEHIRPFLAGPADRKTGAVVAGFPKD